jgi:hypothetical protein
MMSGIEASNTIRYPKNHYVRCIIGAKDTLHNILTSSNSLCLGMQLSLSCSHYWHGNPTVT